jgi:hypothetical protein
MKGEGSNHIHSVELRNYACSILPPTSAWRPAFSEPIPLGVHTVSNEFGLEQLVEELLSVFEDSRKWIHEAVAAIPAERFAEQFPGIPNHPAWTLSHLSTSAAFMGQLLGEDWAAAAADEFSRFGPGSVPVADLTAYEPKNVVLAQLDERHSLLAAAIRAKHATHFAEPTPEFLRAFAPTIGRISVYILTAHENYHLAQLVDWKRAAKIS